MIIDYTHKCPDFGSYRAARVKSLFNAERGDTVRIVADLPLGDEEWSIGVVVGPSGSGKTTIGQNMFPGVGIEDLYAGWPHDAPIIDCIAPGGDFDAATSALSAVGLGDVPAWLRPFNALSNGQKFRAGLARLCAAPPEICIIDEFSSVIDRQIAKIGALAFARAYRKTAARVVLLSCHYDIIEWLQPDWVFDTATSSFKKKAKSGQDQNSPWTFGASIQVTGQCLSRIII